MSHFFSRLSTSLSLAALLFLPAHSFAYHVYVTAEDNHVYVIDTTTDTVITTIAVGENPVSIAINPNGTNAYTANHTSNTATPIDLATNTALTPISAGLTPSNVAFTPDGTKAYITSPGSETLTPIVTATNTPLPNLSLTAAEITVFTPDGVTAYVMGGAALGPGKVTPVTVSTGTVLTAIPVGSQPTSLAITPDGSKIYVTSYTDHSVSVISTASNTVIATITDGINHPIDLAITPDGSSVYVANFGSYFSIISTASNMVIGTAGSDAFRVAITPSGAFAYTTTEGSQVVKIGTTFPYPTTGIEIGHGNTGRLAITPDSAKVYVLNPTDGSVSAIDAATNAVTTITLSSSTPLTAGSNPLALAITPPFSPRNFSGEQKKNDAGLQYSLYNELHWTPSVTSAATYLLYRDGTNIATLPAGSSQYADSRIVKGTVHTYSIIAKSPAGDLSTPLTIQIP